LIPKRAGQPTGAPLTRALELQLIELDLHHITAKLGDLAVFRKDRHLSRLALALLNYLDHLTPGRLLLIIDLAEIEHLTLYDTITTTAPVLHDAPVAVFLAVLEAFGRTQKHARMSDKPARNSKRVGLHYNYIAVALPLPINTLHW
jgi:hypothetical protein